MIQWLDVDEERIGRVKDEMNGLEVPGFTELVDIGVECNLNQPAS